MQVQKSITKQTALKIEPAFPGLQGANMFASEYPIEPVLVFTEFYMDNPVFGPHPHAGVSVMTYMLPDSEIGFINRNSLGEHCIIEPGGLHISQAGSGMLHDEFPQQKNRTAHGFQIWINHTSTNRMITPKGMHVNANQVPEVNTADYKLRVVHGNFKDLSAAAQMVTDINMFHVYLKPNASITLDAKEMAFIYVLKGSGIIADTEIGQRALINFSESGNSITLSSTTEGIEFMYSTAMPLREQITYGGPFVMTTPEQMADTKKRYGRGEMGTLETFKN